MTARSATKHRLPGKPYADSVPAPLVQLISSIEYAAYSLVHGQYRRAYRRIRRIAIPDNALQPLCNQSIQLWRAYNGYRWQDLDRLVTSCPDYEHRAAPSVTCRIDNTESSGFCLTSFKVSHLCLRNSIPQSSRCCHFVLQSSAFWRSLGSRFQYQVSDLIQGRACTDHCSELGKRRRSPPLTRM